jgi:hypothetical protein
MLYGLDTGSIRKKRRIVRTAFLQFEQPPNNIQTVETIMIIMMVSLHYLHFLRLSKWDARACVQLGNPASWRISNEL